MNRQLLFVIGQGRSGTSALGRVLSTHPEIALGLERYKRLWGPIKISTLRAELFERDRFFDFSDGLTNITPESDPRWAAAYDALAKKWDTVRYRGDKMTAVRPMRMWEQLPDAKFVFIVRDIVEVAASWERRATNPSDPGWPETAGAMRAVDRWNRDVGRILRARKRRPRKAILVEHRRFFGDPDGSALVELLEWLGLEHSDETRAAFDEAHATFVGTVAPKQRQLDPEVRRYIDETIDPKTWAEVQRLAL